MSESPGQPAEQKTWKEAEELGAFEDETAQMGEESKEDEDE